MLLLLLLLLLFADPLPENFSDRENNLSANVAISFYNFNSSLGFYFYGDDYLYGDYNDVLLRDSCVDVAL